MSLEDFYYKVKKSEKEQANDSDEQTPRDRAIEAGRELLDEVAFKGGGWSSCRDDLRRIYKEGGMNAVAEFI